MALRKLMIALGEKVPMLKLKRTFWSILKALRGMENQPGRIFGLV